MLANRGFGKASSEANGIQQTNQTKCACQFVAEMDFAAVLASCVGAWAPQKLRQSHWCVPFTATFSKRRKIGALWSERCDIKLELLQSHSFVLYKVVPCNLKREEKPNAHMHASSLESARQQFQFLCTGVRRKLDGFAGHISKFTGSNFDKEMHQEEINQVSPSSFN